MKKKQKVEEEERRRKNLTRMIGISDFYTLYGKLRVVLAQRSQLIIASFGKKP